MKYFTTDQNGITLVDPSDDARREVLSSVLTDQRADFPEVYLSCQGDIVLGYRHDGCLLWEESGEMTRFLPETDIESAMEAWDLLITKDFEQLNALGWIEIE